MFFLIPTVPICQVKDHFNAWSAQGSLLGLCRSYSLRSMNMKYQKVATIVLLLTLSMSFLLSLLLSRCRCSNEIVIRRIAHILAHDQAFPQQGFLALLLPENMILYLSWKVGSKSASCDLHLEKEKKGDFQLGLHASPTLGSWIPYPVRGQEWMVRGRKCGLRRGSSVYPSRSTFHVSSHAMCPRGHPLQATLMDIFALWFHIILINGSWISMKSWLCHLTKVSLPWNFQACGSRALGKKRKQNPPVDELVKNRMATSISTSWFLDISLLAMGWMALYTGH